MTGRRMIAATLLLAGLSGTATAAPFSELIDFGDSLSDVGNAYVGTFGYEPQPPYAGGRFSNGPIWVEDLAGLLGLPAPKPALANVFSNSDFAIGGAQTGSTALHPVAPNDLPTQLGLFNFAHPFGAPSNALYTIWFGANDVLFSDIPAGVQPTPLGTPPPAVVIQAVENELGLVGSLARRGATNFLVLGMPDLGVTPMIRAEGAAVMAQASGLAQNYNQLLASGLTGLAGSTQLSIRFLDTFGLLDSAVNDPARYGFADVTSACWNGNLTGQGTECTSPDNHLFWDGLHPSARGHYLLAEAACQVEGYCIPTTFSASAATVDLNDPDPVPEPGSLALLILPLAGAIVLSRRRPRCQSRRSCGRRAPASR